MKDFPWISLIMMFGCLLLVLVSNFFTTQYKYNNSIETLSEVVRVAGYNSYDYSMRVKDNELLIDRQLFEDKIKKLYALNIGYNINETDVKFQFKYLENTNGSNTGGTSIKSIKALKVSIQNGSDKPYEMTYVADIK